MGLINYKSVKHPKSSTLLCEFANFYAGIRKDIASSVLPIKYADTMYNFCIKNGALSTGLGIDELLFSHFETGEQVPCPWNHNSTPQRLYLFRGFYNQNENVCDRLIVFANNGKLGSTFINTTMGVYFILPKVTLTSEPEVVNYTMPNGADVLLFGSQTDNLQLWSPATDYVEEIENAPKIKSMCVHYERVFACTYDKCNYVWFSDTLDPTNWNVSSSEGGYIEFTDKLNGKANKIISFNGFIYVIRDFGITKISAYASQETFSVSHVYTSSNLIQHNTAVVCGGIVMFLATDGLYAFDGVSVKKVNLGFEDMIINQDQTNARATFYKGKYCIICNTSLFDITEGYCNTLICYDAKTGEYDILSGYYFADIYGVISQDVERLVCIVKTDTENATNEILTINESGKFKLEPTVKIWESAFTDLGYANNKKSISRVSLQTKSACTLTITTEKESIQIPFEGMDVSQTKKVHICGKMVKFRFETSCAECEISHPSIVFQLSKPNA